MIRQGDFWTMASYQIIDINDIFILLVDLDKGRSVTNSAPAVINDLNQTIPGGIGRRAVYYRDTNGRFDRLKTKGGKFAGFAPGSRAQQVQFKQIIEKKLKSGPARSIGSL